MKTPLLLVCALCAFLLGMAPEGKAERLVVFLVRHAEKETTGNDPALTPAGRERAQALARILQDARIDRIHTTDYQRTRETASPLAAKLGVKPNLYDPRRLGALAAALKREGGRQVVVGHSNTTPALVELLGGEPGPAFEEKSEFDRLYLVTIGSKGDVSTVTLRYGAPAAGKK